MNNDQTKVLLAVSPDAPEWMRVVAQTLAEGHEGAHGAILTICYDDTQTQLAQNVCGDDIVSAISGLADSLREKYSGELGKVLAEALIQIAILENRMGEQ